MNEDENSLILGPEAPVSASPTENAPLVSAYQQRRSELIQLLRQIPSIAKLCKDLAEGRTYRAYIPPDVLRRIQGGTARFGIREDTGLLSANILETETGKIIHNVSLVGAPPDFLPSLNNLTIQRTLADIVQKLEIIDEKVTNLLQTQQRILIAEVESGIQTYEQALAARDWDTRSKLLANAIQSLNEGRAKLLQTTDFRFLDELPRSTLGFWFSKHYDAAEFVKSKAEPIFEATYAIIKASKYLILSYVALGEPDSLKVSLQQAEGEIQAFESKLRQMMNWLSPTENWRQALAEITASGLPSLKQLEANQDKAIVVEFWPREITVLEDKDESL